MRQTTHQLEHVRRVGRWLLFTQGLAHWVAVLLIVAVVAGVMDYTLRLPGWLRLVIGLSVVAITAIWFVDWLRAIVKFRPTLESLALRAEQLYPSLGGVLASSLAFSVNRHDFTQPESTNSLVQASIEDTQHRLENVFLRRILKVGPTVQQSLVAAVVLVAFCGAVIAAPEASRLAAKRWLLPLGSAQWPHRTSVRSLMSKPVWPSDTPLAFRAHVGRGYYRGMRTWVVYRLIRLDGQNGSWQSLLMSEQTDTGTGLSTKGSSKLGAHSVSGVFERLVDFGDLFIDPTSQQTHKVAFYFVAGDDQTQLQELELILRPEVASVHAKIDPPAYATGLIESQNNRLDQQSGQVVSMATLVGSNVQIKVVFNKPIAVTDAGWDQFIPGLASYPPATAIDPRSDSDGITRATGIIKSFVIDQSVQTSIHLVDEYGLMNQSEKLYRVEAIDDQLPVVSMPQPSNDEAVLPTAIVDLTAVAQDDVGLQQLVLEAAISSAEDTEAFEKTVDPLATFSGRGMRLEGTHNLDLGQLKLRPGNEVVLTAVAHDVFELNGQHHTPVRSVPRRLRIIDEAELISQIRAELAGIRQQAVRMESQQRRLYESPAETTLPRQTQISQYLDSQAVFLKKLTDRLARNRLESQNAAQVKQLIQRTAALFENAGLSSRAAEQSLGQAINSPEHRSTHRSEAKIEQKQVGELLSELISLLDQGRDALALQLQLQQLKAMEEALSQETRRFMPQTLGWSLEELNKKEKQKLKELAERQNGLAKLAKSMVNQMQSAADSLARQGDNPGDQAAAQALAEAASIARRQGLTNTLNRAAKKTEQNRLSDASGDQQLGLDLMEQMLGELAVVEQRRQAILRRRLMQLVESIRRLIEDQQVQINRLNQAMALNGLEEAQSLLRRKTIVVADRASGTPQSESIGLLLEKAVHAQATAVVALRDANREATHLAQSLAIQRLQEALQAAEALNQQAQNEQLAKQRRKLREAYILLAREQEDIKTQTSKLVNADTLNRRDRAMLVRLGHQEIDLKVSVEQLRDQIDQTLVFTHFHDQIDKILSEVASQLRAAKVNQNLLRRQDIVALILWRMAEALEKQSDNSDFAGQQGGGGGGSGEPPLVPPLAELKLLRGIQEAIYDATRQVQQNQTKPNHGVADILHELSDQQRDVARLGKQMLDKLEQEQRQSTLPTVTDN